MTEYDEQKWVFSWLEWYSNQHPEADLCFAIPNGQYRPGQRPEAGMKAGVPDIFCPVPRGIYHGLFIEMKVPGGTLRDNQDAWLHKLAQQGYLSLDVWGRDQAKDLIELYFNLKDGEYLRLKDS